MDENYVYNRIYIKILEKINFDPFKIKKKEKKMREYLVILLSEGPND